MRMLREDLCLNVSAPYQLSVSTAIFSIILWIFTIPGNLMVILAVFIDPNKNLRTPFNWLVTNLAAADLMVGCLLEPFSTYYHFKESQDPVESLNSFMLKMFHIIFFVTATASVLSLAALSWDRFIAITSPLEYRVKVTSTRAGIISAIIWLVSLTLPPLVYLQVGYIRYSFVFENTVVALTLVILLFTYQRIFRRFRGQVQQWDLLNDSTEESSALRNAMRWETKITKTLILMLVMFLACFAPACAFAYIMNFCDRCSCLVIHCLRDWHFLLVFLSSGLNPIVYGYRLEPYRSAVKKILGFAPCMKRKSVDLPAIA